MRTTIPTHLRVLLFFCPIMAWPDLARASNSHFVELQLTTQRVAEIIHRQLDVHNDFCPFELPCPTGPGTCVFDHFTLGPTGPITRGPSLASRPINAAHAVQGHPVYYSQDLTAYVKTAACASDPSCIFMSIYNFTARYEVYLDTDHRLCVQTESLSGAPPGFDAPGVSRCVDLNYGDLIALLGQSSPSVSGAALALSSAGDRVAIRLEIGRTMADYDAARLGAWTSFSQGAVHSAGAGRDWSTFIHQSLVTQAARARVEAGLAQVPGLVLESTPDFSWSGQGLAGGSLSTSFDIELTDTPCPFDPSASPEVAATLALNPAGNGALLSGTLDPNPDALEAALCATLLAGPISGTFAPFIVDALIPSLPSIGDDCVGVGDLGFSCDTATHPKFIALGSNVLVGMYLSELFGSADGLTLRGDLTVPAALPRSVRVDLMTPRFGLSGSCAGGGSCDYVGAVYVSGNARLCSVSFSHDPSNVFDWGPTSLALPSATEVRVHQPLTAAQKAAGNDGNYRLWVTVKTNQGIITRAFGHVPLLSAEDEVSQCNLARIKAEIDCLIATEEIDILPDELGPDDYYDPLVDVGMAVLDPRGNIIDWALLEGAEVVAQRNLRGFITGMTLRGDARSFFGRSRLGKQTLAIPLSLPSGLQTSVSTALGLAYPSGLLTTTPVQAGLTPLGVSSASLRVSLSGPLLRGKARE